MTKAALNVIDLYLQSDFCRGGNGENEDELWTDRALVAAAPDLLAALIELDAWAIYGSGTEYPQGTFEAVREAITKAIGAA